MHDSAEFLQQISGFLGGYYLALAVMNGIAAYYLWHFKHRNVDALIWTCFAGLMVILSPLAYSGSPPGFPFWIKDAVNQATGPVVYSVGTTAILAVLFIFRRQVVQPMMAWFLFNAVLVIMGLSMADPNFAAIVTKADNVPIVGLIYLLGFFTWLATAQAVENDDRIARGLEPREKLDNEKVLVWPDLVYTELICMLAITAFLLIWGLALQAPLEEPASRVKTPNPSKAPWYFLGLQEMLVYYDPWMAGVVLPSLIIVGLMAIPYIDFNKEGNGYFTINQRKFSYLIFQFGFLELWVTLIILGTFFRGPNWNIFGPFENWDAHKVLALNNVDLSQYFWTFWLDKGMPKAPPGSGVLHTFVNIGYIMYREWLGIVLVLGYFLLLPPLMATTIFRKYFVKMGFNRYMLMASLFLFMSALPIKMVLRWVFNLKYIIAIPEYFLNF
jgi:Cytochrome b(C-terminal)/b6/petD